MPNIEQRLDEIRRKEGFFRSISLNESGEESFLGAINLSNHELQLSYPGNYDEIALQDEKTADYIKKKLAINRKDKDSANDNLEVESTDQKTEPDTELIRRDKLATAKILEDILLHEICHRGLFLISGCPIDIEHKEKDFIEPITEVLKDYTEETAYYVTNALTDIIDNINCRQRGDMAGMWLFYDNEGRKIKKYTQFYDGFVRLQLWLSGTKDELGLLKRYSTRARDVKKAVNNFIKRTGLNAGEQERNREYLMNPENWQKISTIFAEEFKQLIDKEPPQENLPGAGGKGGRGDSEKKGSGIGKKKKDAQKQEGNGNGDLPKDGFSDEFKDPTNRRGFVLKRYTDNKNSSNFQPPAYMDSFEALDYLYKALASRIPVETDSLTKSHDFPIVTLKHRAFERGDEVTSISPRIILDRTKPALSVPSLKYSIPLGVKAGVVNYPDFQMCLIDTSESTQHSPTCPYLGCDSHSCAGKIINPFAPAEQQWGDKSKYHYELLAWSGIINYLTSQGLLRSISTSLVNFSSQTRTARNLEEATKLAFSPQFGGTAIDLDKIKQIFPQNSKSKVIFSLSDGEVQGWDSIEKEYIEMARENLYFHIQFGRDSVMTTALKKAGIPVYNIDSGEELTRLAVNLTRKTYENYARR